MLPDSIHNVRKGDVNVDPDTPGLPKIHNPSWEAVVKAFVCNQ